MEPMFLADLQTLQWMCCSQRYTFILLLFIY